MSYVVVELINQRYDKVTGAEQGMFSDQLWTQLLAELEDATHASLCGTEASAEGVSFTALVSTDLPPALVNILEPEGGFEPLLAFRERVEHVGGICRILVAHDATVTVPPPG